MMFYKVDTYYLICMQL